MGAANLFAALLLAMSAGHKLRAHDRMMLATARLTDTTPANAANLMVLAGGIEAIAALLLLLPGATSLGAGLAAALWAAYAVALWRQRGQSLDCGCDWVSRSRPIDTAHIARPALLATLAVSIAVLPEATAGPLALDVLGAVGGLALYFAAAELLAIPRPFWRKA